jgi:hypothetical protein
MSSFSQKRPLKTSVKSIPDPVEPELRQSLR